MDKVEIKTRDGNWPAYIFHPSAERHWTSLIDLLKAKLAS